MEAEIGAAQRFLIEAQLADGSWPYYLTAGQGSPEPTCYSLLALRDAGSTFEEAALQRALGWLEGRVNAQGAVVLPGDDEPHWSTAHLAFTLVHLDRLAAVRGRTINWLLTWRASAAPPDPYGAIQIDTSLVGWPWIGDTFSWVEPTCTALLALKLSGVRQHGRISEAEKLLYDRVCLGGGWNVGNPIVWDQPLDAFLPVTALALLALQDAAAGEVIDQGLAFLRDESNRAYSSLSLALTILCMQAYGRPTELFVDRLLARQGDDGSWRQMTQLTALAALALQSVTGGINVFKL